MSAQRLDDGWFRTAPILGFMSKPTLAPRRRGIDPAASEARILAAADELVIAGEFANATVTDLAERAGVARATVFSRFGSKLGVLEALSTRCAGGPEMLAIRAAVALDDHRVVVPEMVAASCRLWERQGYIMTTLRAVAELEPDARALIEDQRRDQREGCRTVVSTMAAAGRCGSATRTELNHLAASLHLITSLESFTELRRNAGLSLPVTITLLTRMALGLFTPDHSQMP